eukprot:CAMPEP_0205948902 /NCGR_PEP_ID=MMETSP1459-20131121/1166_1 /ASSEMBLY_ACC=CAM_ASM_001120 /TAXON_ID=41880 /ORGANISM="Pycnococcus provasolii, Strain RCC931" /LENGTH=868 /DNA_ID=CAMNT_0053320331 /DNA_START=210 /DNA_END=2816 /DNA_ORIENTATION=-
MASSVCTSSAWRRNALHGAATAHSVKNTRKGRASMVTPPRAMTMTQQQQQQQESAASSTSSSAELSATEEDEQPTTSIIKKTIQKERPRVDSNNAAWVTLNVTDVPTSFGDHLCLVGSGVELGDWDVLNSIPMDFIETPYPMWTAKIALPPRSIVEYKYVIRCGWDEQGPFNWQGGANGIIATNFAHSDATVNDRWHGGHVDEKAEGALVAATEVYRAALQDVHTEVVEIVVDAEGNPISSGDEEDAEAAEAQQEDEKPEDVHVPQWAKEAVFYHIYPQGFFDAPFSNLTHDAPVTPRLALIRDYYDHFEKLGITAIYLSPIFEADTHGYDTLDYFTVDRRLGDNALFKEIVDELHERGIRVVLDGVFNHTGVNHHAFVDLCVNGAGKSHFGEWYHVGARTTDFSGWCTVDWDSDLDPEQHFNKVGRGGSRAGPEGIGEREVGFAFDCWEGHSSLPRLNHSHRPVREHIFDVARYWLTEMGIDGWRLDVAHEIEPEFWAEFRHVCQEAKPDSILIGELIHGNYNTWTDNHLLHSGTNYQLQKPIWSSLNDRNYHELRHALLRECALYSRLTLLTFLGNHDVTRITSQLHERRHVMLANAFLLFARGIPCLYYGDEIAMEGKAIEGSPERDFPLRRPMPEVVPQEGLEALDMTSHLVHVRRSVPALNSGELNASEVSCTQETLQFTRRLDKQVAVCAFNCSTEQGHHVTLSAPHDCEPGTIFVDVLDNGRKKYVLTGDRVLVPAPEPPKPAAGSTATQPKNMPLPHSHPVCLDPCQVMCIVSECPPELAKVPVQTVKKQSYKKSPAPSVGVAPPKAAAPVAALPAAAPEAVAEAAAPAPTTETIEDMKAQLMAENERLRQKAAMLDLGN